MCFNDHMKLQYIVQVCTWLQHLVYKARRTNFSGSHRQMDKWWWILILVGRLTFVFCHLLTFVRYNRAYCMFGLLHCIRYNKDFVILWFIKSSFFPIYFIVTLTGLKNIIIIPRTLLYSSLLNQTSTVPHVIKQ